MADVGHSPRSIEQLLLEAGHLAELGTFKYRHVLPVLFSTAFPDRSPLWRRRKAYQLMASMERGRRDHADLARGAHADRIDNEQVLDRLARDRSGAVLVSVHLGPFQYFPTTIAFRGVPVATYAANQMNRVWGDVWEAMIEERKGEVVIMSAEAPSSALRAFRTLRRGGWVAVFADAYLGARLLDPKRSVDVPVLGARVRIRTGPADLAARAQVPMVAGVVHRDGRGRRILSLSDPMPPPKDDSLEAAGASMAALLDWCRPFVRRYPEQYEGLILEPMAWADRGEAPSATVEALRHETSAMAERLARGRGRLVTDGTSITAAEVKGQWILLDGPRRLWVWSSETAGRLVLAAGLRISLRQLARMPELDQERLTTELARVVLGGFARLED